VEKPELRNTLTYLLAYATSMTSVPLSVRLSVTLVDCDHLVRQKVEMGTLQDRSVSWVSA